MSITKEEFRVCMEACGAEIIKEEKVQDGKFVNYFMICGVKFLHNGERYALILEPKLAKNVIDSVIAKFGGKYSAKANIWRNEVHTVDALLTVILMLQKNYSEENLVKLVNKVYKNLFTCEFLQQKLQVQNMKYSKYEELYKVLKDYMEVVNPFRKNNQLKKPSEYLDKVKVSLSTSHENSEFGQLTLSNTIVNMNYINDSKGWSYSTFIRLDAPGILEYVDLRYYSAKENESSHFENIVILHEISSLNYQKFNKCNKCNLKINVEDETIRSLEVGYEDEGVNEQEIKSIVEYLKLCIFKVNEKLLAEMKEI